MKYCKSCGHELRPNAKVCTNCGEKVDSHESEEVNGNKTKSAAATATYKQRGMTDDKEPMDPKKKRLMLIVGGIIAVAAIALFIVYQVLDNKYSPEGSLNDLADAVSAENAEEVQKAIDNDISPEEAEAYISYIDTEVGFSQFTSWVQSSINAINEGNPGSTIHDGAFMLLEVKQNGKSLGMFENYDLIIPKHNVMIDEEITGDTFKYEYNGNENEWSTSDSKFAELIPGKYQFEGAMSVGDKEYESTVSANFGQYSEYDTIHADADVNMYYVNFDIPVLWGWYDLEPEDFSISVNGKEQEVTVDNDDENKLGPYKYGEDYEITGTLNYEGKSFEMNPVTVNVTNDDTLNERKHTATLEFDEEAMMGHSDEVAESQMAEEDREAFEENMESNAEQFIKDYFYDLEEAYEARDIVFIEEYLIEGSDPYETLKSNFANDNFPNLEIWSVDMVKFERDDEDVYIEVYTERINDDLEEVTEFKTGYNLQYNPDDLSFKILSFVDL
ncbi:TcaA second domain-containing protein [Salinicoccus sp. HZC-1]|uniref:TcaA NTF2-like domain-containing protein n=1 Tax=Salinicoccus sp. HZC-1 TaxID=3385497 RepID=UPI00398A527A